MISLTLLSIAAILNAAMDLSKDLFEVSTFRRFPSEFWKANVSYRFHRISGYPLDFWHLCKSGMIICFVLMTLFYAPVFGLSWWVMGLVYGAVWQVVFNLFYLIIFRL